MIVSPVWGRPAKTLPRVAGEKQALWLRTFWYDYWNHSEGEKSMTKSLWQWWWWWQWRRTCWPPANSWPAPWPLDCLLSWTGSTFLGSHTVIGKPSKKLPKFRFCLNRRDWDSVRQFFLRLPILLSYCWDGWRIFTEYHDIAFLPCPRRWQLNSFSDILVLRFYQQFWSW